MSYLDGFDFERPRESVDVVLKRLKKAVGLDDEMAGFFKERAAIEDRYATDLAKLSKRTFADKTDPDYVGTVGGLWNEIISATANAAKSRSTFASQLSSIESAFKTRCDKDEEGNWPKVRQGSSALSANYESEFVRSTRDYAEKILKVDKLDAKNKKKVGAQIDKKMQDAMTLLESAKSQWETEATRQFQKFERMDRQRLEYIKQTISLYATQEIGASEAISATHSGLLVASSEFSVDAEIANFAQSKGTRFGNVAGGRSSQTGSMHRVDSSLATGNATVSRSGSIMAVSHKSSLPTVQQEGKVLVDEEGFTIRPDTATDPFKMSFGGNAAGLNGDGFDDDGDGDDHFKSQPKIKVAIKEKAIIENPNEAQNVMLSLAAKLQAPSRTLTGQKSRTRTYSTSTTTTSPVTSAEQAIPPPHAAAANGSTPSVTITESLHVSMEATIQETINVLQVDGQVDKILVTGEIQLQLSDSAAADGVLLLQLQQLPPSDVVVRLRIDRSEMLQQIVPNETFVKAEPSRAGEYELNLLHLAPYAAGPVQLFKYLVAANASSDFSPVSIKPMWKCEEKQASLLLAYELNAGLVERLALNEISVMASVQGGGEIGAVQTKPSGIWDLDSRCILWQLPGVFHGADDHHSRNGTESDRASIRSNGGVMNGSGSGPQKLLARIETSEMCQPDPIVVRFASASSSMSGIGVSVMPVRVPTLLVPDMVRIHQSITAGKFGAQGIVVSEPASEPASEPVLVSQ
ncbi:Muniscin C-terminal mu homology domain-containing protein [Entophlyctis helioformis]|nr:Muniscin C-terminal mu homology domain-containing protein [Entophlyctis helioformis]